MTKPFWIVDPCNDKLCMPEESLEQGRRLAPFSVWTLSEDEKAEHAVCISYCSTAQRAWQFAAELARKGFRTRVYKTSTQIVYTPIRRVHGVQLDELYEACASYRKRFDKPDQGTLL